MSLKRKRKSELKKEYRFMAFKNKAMRTFRIIAYDEAEAKEKAKKKYPDWSISPFPKK